VRRLWRGPPNVDGYSSFFTVALHRDQDPYFGGVMVRAPGTREEMSALAGTYPRHDCQPVFFDEYCVGSIEAATFKRSMMWTMLATSSTSTPVVRNDRARSSPGRARTPPPNSLLGARSPQVAPVGPQAPPTTPTASAVDSARRGSRGPPMDYRDNLLRLDQTGSSG
jgi:hypothetical protein